MERYLQKLSPEAGERTRQSIEEAGDVIPGVVEHVNGEDDVVLRAAIDKGMASGIAEPGVFSRVRKRHDLPPRDFAV